ncbi:MAG: hypothetical protein KBD43_07135, partial [Saprospiraceae bacterium]|nr:hypothetical protein [Saprospiraceae bacterium]
YLYLRSVTSIPEGFNPTVGGYLDLRSVTSIPEGFNPTVGGYLDLGSVTSIPEGFNPTVGGSLDLGSVTSIPEGFNPTVGGSLDLGSVTSIPEGFNPTVGGYLDLGSVTSIPEGFNPTVGGSLYLGSVTSIPEGFNPTVGGSLDLGSVTSIPEGFNPTVGGYLYLRSVTSIPEGFNKEDYENKPVPPVTPCKFLSWDQGRYIFCDDRFSEVISKKRNVWRLKDLNKNNEYYLITDNKGNYAHGDTIQEAKEDLLYKTTEKDTSQFKNIDLNESIPFEKCISMYRAITGACAAGVRNFIEGAGIKKKKYSINEIIKLTKNQYGGNSFSNFFNK